MGAYLKERVLHISNLNSDCHNTFQLLNNNKKLSSSGKEVSQGMWLGWGLNTVCYYFSRLYVSYWSGRSFWLGCVVHTTTESKHCISCSLFYSYSQYPTVFLCSLNIWNWLFLKKHACFNLPSMSPLPVFFSTLHTWLIYITYLVPVVPWVGTLSRQFKIEHLVTFYLKQKWCLLA